MTDHGRVKESGSIYGIAHEAQHVDGRKVDCQPRCRPSPEVVDRLGIEGRRPTERAEER